MNLSELQRFSWATMFAVGERTQLHILDPNYWRLMHELGVNEIEFVDCQFYGIIKGDKSLNSYTNALNYTVPILFTET